MKSAYVLSLACCLFATGLALPTPVGKHRDNNGRFSVDFSTRNRIKLNASTLDGVIHHPDDDLGFRIVGSNIALTPIDIPLPEVVVPWQSQTVAQTASHGENNVTWKKEETKLPPRNTCLIGPSGVSEKNPSISEDIFIPREKVEYLLKLAAKWKSNVTEKTEEEKNLINNITEKPANVEVGSKSLDENYDVNAQELVKVNVTTVLVK